MTRKTFGRPAAASLVLAALAVTPVAIGSGTADAAVAAHPAAALDLAGSYAYTDSLGDSETLMLSSDNALVFSSSGCTGEWVTSKKTVAMEIGSGCDSWVFLGTARKVKVGHATIYALSGTGNAANGVGFTWMATES
jgi:hypothetical protein